MDDSYLLLQEDTSQTYEPTAEEIQEEAKFLGIDPKDENYFWIAREALLVNVSESTCE